MTTLRTTSSITTATHNLTGKPIHRPERRLTFSSRASIGTVEIHPCEPLPALREVRPLAEHTARFTVIVPEGMCARLAVGAARVPWSALLPVAEWSSHALDELSLVRHPIGDAGFRRFAGLTGLRFLDLYGTDLTDASGPNIGGLAGLEWLSLTSTRIGDAGVAALGGLDDLIRLSLWGTPITDAALASLAGLPNLRWLSLAHTAVTASGVEWLLSRAPALRWIAINGTPAAAARPWWLAHRAFSVEFVHH
ncbi:MAG: leucine-rich repeat domain-containing protein [Actinomycetes bacterium]